MSVPFYLSYGMLWVLVVFQGLVLLGLARAVYRIQSPGASPLISADGNLRGEESPKFSAVDARGNVIHSGEFAGRQTALLFVSPSCRSCTASLEEIDALRWKADGHVIVICRGGSHECHELLDRYDLDLPVVIDDDFHISEMFRVSAVPTAVLIGRDNRIESYGNPMRDGEVIEQAATA